VWLCFSGGCYCGWSVCWLIFLLLWVLSVGGTFGWRLCVVVVVELGVGVSSITDRTVYYRFGK
ncbi:hypothetical protein, partial [Citrobacter freundii]|uniref:hypothetical protein n=1 Tax=Citrobacter freundii TaxID=546 RepID=UPI0019D260A1